MVPHGASVPASQSFNPPPNTVARAAVVVRPVPASRARLAGARLPVIRLETSAVRPWLGACARRNAKCRRGVGEVASGPGRSWHTRPRNIVDSPLHRSRKVHHRMVPGSALRSPSSAVIPPVRRPWRIRSIASAHTRCVACSQISCRQPVSRLGCIADTPY